MEISDIFPEASMKQIFGDAIKITKRERSRLAEVARLKPSSLLEIGGSAWDRYIQANPKTNPQVLARYFDRQDPKTYLAMERYVGFKVLHEICYTVAEIEDDQLEEKVAAELLVAVTYPKVLHIADVTFADPYQKIPEQDRRFKFKFYKGLGLFPETLARCDDYCNVKNIREITLSAAYNDLVPFFRRYGFDIDDTPLGRMYPKIEYGIPMIRTVPAKT